MVVIGLTGGFLSGKSTVIQMLKEMGAVVIDADKVGHEAYLPGTPIWREVVAAFGRGILGEDGGIDRRKLGGIVFNDPQALKRLNEIMHPRMRQRMAEMLAELRRDGARVVVLEAAVLLEAGWDSLVDQVWVTVVPEETALKRLQGRGDKLTLEQARARIRSQISNEQRAARAHQVINTDCSLGEVRARVEELWRGLDQGRPDPPRTPAQEREGPGRIAL